MQIFRDIQIVAMAHGSVNFSVSEWTTLDLADLGPNLTVAQPGEDIGSILIENKSSSASAVHFVFKDNPGADFSYSHGFEIAAGGVLQEGTVKVILRSYRTADQAPWDN